MHILILEAGLTGHHANYLERIATTFLAQGHRLTVCVRQEHSENPLFVRVQAQHPGRVDVKVIQPLPSWTQVFGRLGVVGSELSHWLIFKRSFEQLSNTDQVDHVFLPYLDYCLHATALLGSPCGNVSWAGICMRPSFHYISAGVIAPKPKWSSIKERLFYRLLRQTSLNKLLTIDELLEEQTRRKCPFDAQKLAFIPDPAELTNDFDRASARRRLGISENDFVILVYGVIDNRKGLTHLLAGVRKESFPKNLKILVIGKHAPELREQLLCEPQVISIDQYVDTATEEASFRAADVVWMGYQSHYSMSGVLVLAAMAAKPVLATKYGLIGWMTQRYALGIVIDCENSQEVTKAVHALLVEPPSILSNCGMQTIQMRHTWTEFNRKILQSLLLRDS